MPISIEQMCRDLLHLAIRDDLVRHPEDVFDGTLSSELEPPAWSSGDLCGMANLLQSYLRCEPADGNEPITAEWLKSEGFRAEGSELHRETGAVTIVGETSPLTRFVLISIHDYGAANDEDITIVFRHIKTRSQFRQLIALLAPDWKAGS